MTPQEAKDMLEQAEEVIDAATLDAAIDRLSVNMTVDLADKNPLLICVMNGAVPFMGALMTRLHFPLQTGYVHASRYRNESSGGSLDFMVQPKLELKDRTVVLVDDVFDEGATLLALANWCRENDVGDVKVAVLVNKLRDGQAQLDLDYVAIETEDKFLVGYGMDYQGYWRNLNSIYALNGVG